MVIAMIIDTGKINDNANFVVYFQYAEQAIRGQDALLMDKADFSSI